MDDNNGEISLDLSKKRRLAFKIRDEERQDHIVAPTRFPSDSVHLIMETTIFCYILQFLSIKEVCVTINRVCKKWSHDASSNSVWRSKWNAIINRMSRREKFEEMEKVSSSYKKLLVENVLDICPVIVDSELRAWRLPTSFHYQERLRANLGWVLALRNPDTCAMYSKLCSSIQILRRRNNTVLDIVLPGIDSHTAKWIEVEMKSVFLIRCGQYQVLGQESEHTMDKLFEDQFTGLSNFSEYVLPRIGLEDTSYHRQNFLAICNILFNVMFNREKVSLAILPTIGNNYSKYPKCRWSTRY